MGLRPTQAAAPISTLKQTSANKQPVNVAGRTDWTAK